MWIIIYLAKGREAVLKLRKALENEGILVMVRQKTEEENPQELFMRYLFLILRLSRRRILLSAKAEYMRYTNIRGEIYLKGTK